MIGNKVFFLKIPHVSEKLFNSHLTHVPHIWSSHLVKFRTFKTCFGVNTLLIVYS